MLSRDSRARGDPRFAEALAVLAGKCDARGRLVVERPNRKLALLALCRPGEPFSAATRRYHEIVAHMGG